MWFISLLAGHLPQVAQSDWQWLKIWWESCYLYLWKHSTSINSRQD